MRRRSCQAGKYLIRESSAAGSEREEENDEDFVKSFILTATAVKNEDDEEIPVFKMNRKSGRLFLDHHLFKFPPGLLRPFLDARNADFKDAGMYVCMYNNNNNNNNNYYAVVF